MTIRRKYIAFSPNGVDTRRSGHHAEWVNATNTSTAMDPLGEALHSLRISGTFYCRSELSAPWGLTLPRMPGYLWFHVVTAGGCSLEMNDTEPRPLRPGDFALVPHGRGHCLRSEPGAAAPSVLELEHDYTSDTYAVLRHGGGGTPTTLICGLVEIDHPAGQHVAELLPHLIHLETLTVPQNEWMHATLRLIAAEGDAVRPGGESMITRLSDILVIQALRWWTQHDPAARTGWLGALHDPQIGRAISLLHHHPERPWTLGSLADAVAMSRSAFAARFNELVGEPAMHYLARWRMQLARDHLEHKDAAVGEIAEQLGYRSEAAFSRAFKRIIGIPPGSVRRTRPTLE